MQSLVTPCAGCISANVSLHWLHWGEQEMWTAVSCSQEAAFMLNVPRFPELKPKNKNGGGLGP